MTGDGKAKDLPDMLREITDMGRPALLGLWGDSIGREPPPRLATSLIRRILAHEVQVRALGGLSGKDRRALVAIVTGRNVASALPRATAPGSGLVREWIGRLYRVEVVDHGYVLDGTTYRSLSAVAKKITGTAWSGPRFFGLTAKRSA